MAKKKSKTQKYKKNQKKKIQKEQIKAQEQKNNVVETPKNIANKQLVPKDKVKYNVVLTSNQKEIQNKSQKNSEIPKINKKADKIKELLNIKKYFQRKTSSQNLKSTKKDIPKAKENKCQNTGDLKKKNIFYRLLFEIRQNTHIIFNTLIIVTFITMLVGLIRINVFKTGTIIYICCIALFLMLVAISYNKYLSGKIFTLLLTLIMGFAIYQMQYTYDFIRNLNSAVYKYKTYYVVTFNTNANRSIYNINNKKVGLPKENCVNIERKLNTKLDQVNYNEYEDLNQLYNDFFNQQLRAIIINENQYKYLTNYINENSRDVKILYEFEVNAKK